MNVSTSRPSSTFRNIFVPPSKWTCSRARAGGTSSPTRKGCTLHQRGDGDERQGQQQADGREEEAVYRQEVARLDRVQAGQNQKTRGQHDADAHEHQVGLLENVPDVFARHRGLPL